MSKVRFVQGEVKRLLAHFNMVPLKKGSRIYGGFGKDGIWRTCSFHYHKDSDFIPEGTANSIAKALNFKDSLEMKEYIKKI